MRSTELTLLLAILVPGCGGGPSAPLRPPADPTPTPAPPPPVATGVIVSCTPASVLSNGTSQCSAIVAPPSANQAVTWKAFNGVMTAAGVYTAPNSTIVFTDTVVASVTSNLAISGTFSITVTPPAPSPPAVVGPFNLGTGIDPLMRVDSVGTIDVVWKDPTGIEFRRSVDNGVTFSTAQLVIPEPVYGDFVEMRIDNANAITIFSLYQGPDDPNPVPQLAHSTDGQNFQLHAVPSPGEFPDLVVEPSGAIDIAWFGFGDNTLHAIRSTDGGVTFSSPKTIWTTTDDVLDVDAATGPQGQLYLFFGHEASGCDILFSASLDGSQTFSTPKTISSPSANCNAGQVPQVDAAGNLSVAWDDTKSVFFAHSADQGQTFTVSTVVTEPSNTGQEQFTVGPNGEIDLVFASVGAVAFETFFTQSTNTGVTFSAPVQLSLPNVANFTGGGDPAVAVDSNGKVTVAWEDDSNGSYSGDDDIYTRTSTDGINFTAAVDLSNTTDQTEIFPQIIVSQTGVRYFVWSDTADIQATNPVVSSFFDAVP